MGEEKYLFTIIIIYNFQFIYYFYSLQFSYLQFSIRIYFKIQFICLLGKSLLKVNGVQNNIKPYEDEHNLYFQLNNPFKKISYCFMENNHILRYLPHLLTSYRALQPLTSALANKAKLNANMMLMNEQSHYNSRIIAASVCMLS